MEESERTEGGSPVPPVEVGQAMVGKELWEEIRRRFKAGERKKRIARELRLDPKTVRRALRQMEWAPYRTAGRPSLLRPHREWVDRLMPEADFNAAVIFARLKLLRGYEGSYATVRDYVARHRRERDLAEKVTLRFSDGPFAPLEFTRQSSDGRITLVIDPDSQAKPARLLWAHMIPVELSVAKEALRDREGMTGTDWLSQIGSWQRGVSPPTCILGLPQWVDAHGLDAVVWTALGPKFPGKKKDERPSSSDVINYLRNLEREDGESLRKAREYIERAPRQIDTDYRRQIEAALGWLCKDGSGT